MGAIISIIIIFILLRVIRLIIKAALDAHDRTKDKFSKENNRKQEYKESTPHRDEDIYDRNGWNKEGCVMLPHSDTFIST